jgi:hypothetical protein
MLVICAGMPKSGSAYLYNLLNDLHVAAGYRDAREIQMKYDLTHFMKPDNCNFGKSGIVKTWRLCRLARKERAFVVKTHAGPDLLARLLNRLDRVRIVYSLRDPRDALVSAVDHVHRWNPGTKSVFTKMAEDFGFALRTVDSWLKVAREYQRMPGVQLVKYEELWGNPEDVVGRLQDFLGLSVDSKEVQGVLWRYSRHNPQVQRRFLHLNKAQCGRYVTELTEKQKARCRKRFGEYLAELGYPLEDVPTALSRTA